MFKHKFLSFFVFLFLIVLGFWINPTPAHALCNYIPGSSGYAPTITGFSVSLGSNDILSTNGTFKAGSECTLNGMIFDGIPATGINSTTLGSTGPNCTSTSCTYSPTFNVSSLPNGTYTATFDVSGFWGNSIQWTSSFVINRPPSSFTVSASAGTGGTFTSTGTSTDSKTGITSGATTSFSLNYPGYTPAPVTSDNPGCRTDGMGWSSNTYTTGTINANCTYTFSFTPLPMSGTLTASDCTIAAGASSCNSNLTWTTTNPEATSAVTTPTGITVATGNSGSTTYGIVPGPGTRTFYLYNNAKSLVPTSPNGTGVIATAVCASGTAWNGSVCAVNPISVTLSASPTSMTLPTNATTLTWTTTGTPDSCAASNAWTGAKAPTGGTQSMTGLTAGTYTYVITCSKAGLTDVSSTATVIVSSAPIMSGTLTPTSSTCTIASGASTCTQTLTWTTTNPVATSAVTSATGTPSPANGNNGSQIFTIPYNGGIASWFTLYNNAQQLAQASVTPSCAVNTTWNGSTCVLNNPTSGTLNATGCVIPAGNSSCMGTITWNTVNPQGTSNITSDTPLANTIITTGNSGNSFPVNVPFNSRKFFLNNNAITIAGPATAYANCASGTGWDPVSGTCKIGAATCADPRAINYPTCTTDANGKCLNGAYNPVTCNTYSCSTGYTFDGTSCVLSNGVTVGTCSNPAKHTNPCLTGTPSPVTNTPSQWTWTCNGTGGGSSASCVELKKKPKFIEN